MKFLLTAINAKYIHSNPAVYSLRAYAGEEMQKYIAIAEYTINQDIKEILADIYKQQADVIGFSCYIWNWRIIQELIVELHKILPKLPIWLGGPEVSFDADKIIADMPMVTGIMVGEGEETFRELLDYYVKKRKSLKQISGLYLSEGYTAVRELTDLNSLPFLYENLEEFKNRIIYYESSRGCPYRCSYCLSSIDKKVRLRNFAIVKKELQFFLDHKVAQVKFIDRTFNCNHQHAINIWQYIYEHDNGITNFHFEIAADILQEEELNLLRKMRPGLVQLEIGVQTIHSQTLKEIHRRMDVDKLEQIVSYLREGNNIHQHLDLIAGLPYEDYSSFAESFSRVYKMYPQQLQLGFLKVLKGSAIYQKAEEYGICYQEKPPYEVLFTKWLPYEKVQKLKQIEEMVERYYNSCQYTHTLLFLEKAFESPFAMFEKMAEFFYEKGYFSNSPARSYYYSILLSFAEEYNGENLDIYKELLTYDMYLRENLKSRSEFMKDLSLYKDVFWQFYKDEQKNRKFLEGYSQYDFRQMAKMTHLEPFFYPVWDCEKIKKRTEEKEGIPSYFLLFDYQKRNPLTYEARIKILSKNELIVLL